MELPFGVVATTLDGTLLGTRVGRGGLSRPFNPALLLVSAFAAGLSGTRGGGPRGGCGPLPLPMALPMAPRGPEDGGRVGELRRGRVGELRRA